MASPHRLETEEAIRDLVKRIRRVAVLGIKTEAQSDQPAFYVPEYLASVGLEVVPVPVYYPEVKEILGKPVYRRLVDVPGELDLVDVFRRPKDLEAPPRRHPGEEAEGGLAAGRASGTTRWPTGWPPRASTWCRTAA